MVFTIFIKRSRAGVASLRLSFAVNTSDCAAHPPRVREIINLHVAAARAAINISRDVASALSRVLIYRALKSPVSIVCHCYAAGMLFPSDVISTYLFDLARFEIAATDTASLLHGALYRNYPVPRVKRRQRRNGLPLIVGHSSLHCDYFAPAALFPVSVS